MATRKRFAQTTEEDANEKRLKLNSNNTLRCNRKSANILRDYLIENGKNGNFESLSATELNNVLAQFYLDIRKSDGEMYKTNSFEGVRNGLKRNLQMPPLNKSFDIVKDKDFQEANLNFQATIAELKRKGLGSTTHHPVISEVDRQKLYNSLFLSTETPTGLANKAQYDIRIFFCRRGMENMAQMKRDTFAVAKDSTGLKYVYKACDELTKNHRESDKEIVSGIMPESKGSPFCPVASFENYMSLLHPENNRLWQKPLESFTEDSPVWYSKLPIGEKKISTFMSELSKKCELSRVYTNHSCRATGATILSKGMYGAAQIMAVTGHKSVQSLTTYQRVDTAEKIKMGQTISNNIVPPNNSQLAVEYVSRPVVTYQTHNPACVVPSNSNPPAHHSTVQCLDGIDLDELFSDFTSDVQTSVQTPDPARNAPATNSWNQTNPQVFYGNVTFINNLTINK